MNLNEFKIHNESNDAFEIGHPNGKKITIKKKGLSDKSYTLIQKLKGNESLAKGGLVAPEDPSADADLDNLTGSSVPEYLKPNTPEQVAQHPGFAPIEQITQGQPMPATDITGSNGLFNDKPPEAIAAATESQTPSRELQPKEVAKAAPAEANPQEMLSQKQGGINAALEAQKGFNTQIGQAESTQAQQEQQAINKAQSQVDLMQTQQDLVNQYKVKDQAFQDMLQKQNIDPNRYFNNMSTGNKIAQGIALVLGGIGSGLTNQPNAALSLMKDFIDRDIDAQKNDQSKTMNLWKMNKELLGNDLAANLATKNQLYTGLQYQLKKAAAQAQGPIAVARIGAANSQIDQQIAQNRLQQSLVQIGIGQGRQGAAGADPSILVPQMVPPDRQAQVFKEIDAAQNTRKMASSIMKSFEQAVKENTVMKTGAGLVRTPGSVYALHQAMQPTFADLEGTVRQAAMDNTFKNITPAPGDSDYTIQQKRESVREYLRSKEAAPTARGYGIDLKKFKSTSADPTLSFTPEQKNYYDFAIKNPENPKSKMVLKKLGVE